ncbi:MAG: ATP-grasp domain-containing protein, partial [archaeon]|nr:ATP-grasp domain-containing protein [archaeon]
KICQDKFRFNEVMKNNDVPVPNAVHITCEKDIEKCFETLSTDGRKVWIRAVRGAGSRAALPVNNVKHAKMWIDYWISMRGLNYSDFMMSEFLPKKEFAFQSIWKDGQIVMSQARERQEYVFGNLTASGQSSSPSIAKTVHRDDVNKTATDAVLACDKNATGIFCVDLKENLDEIPCVTEINLGRFFTTSNFFSRAGCNMPYNYIKLAFGEVAEKFPKYNALDENIYWIRLMDSGNVMIRNSGWTSKEL